MAVELAQRLHALAPQAMTTMAAAAAEVLMSGYVEYQRRLGSEDHRLRAVLDRVWSLSEGSDDPDVWADADATCELAERIDATTAESAAARAAALAVHFAVRTWLVEGGEQAALAVDQALQSGPSGTAERLLGALDLLESGASPALVRSEIRA